MHISNTISMRHNGHDTCTNLDHHVTTVGLKMIGWMLKTVT